MNSIKNLLEKELKNTGTKKLNDDIVVNEVNIIGKKIKNEISLIEISVITVINNEIEHIMKIIRS